MSPFRGILGTAFGAVLGVAPQQHPPPMRTPPPPLVAPIPREKPPVTSVEKATEKEGRAPVAAANAGATDPVAPAPRTGAAAAPPTPSKAVVAGIPIPRPNPYRLRLATIVPPAYSAPARNDVATRSASLPAASVQRGEDPVCVNTLMDSRVQFKVMPSNENGSCGAVQPLQVSASLRDNGVKFTPAAVMVCSQTRAVLAWLDKEVQPAAATYLGGPVTAIDVASSYSCRGVNNARGGKLSEHAAANALDVGGFQIGTGKQAYWVKVAARKDPNDPEAKFLDTVRKAACVHFTTVLGPGQPDHDTHFHFDNAVRGRNSNYRICQ